MRGARHHGPRQYGTPYNLSPAQMRVMLLLVEGLTNTQIADRLFVTVTAVEKQIPQIYDRMGISAESRRGGTGAARVQAAVRWIREQEYGREAVAA